MLLSELRAEGHGARIHGPAIKAWRIPFRPAPVPAAVNENEAVLLFVDEYTRMAEAYDANVAPRFEPLAARLVDRANPPAHGTVLDVSTGTGLAALLAAKAMGGTGLVVGIDLADGALNLAQTKAARAGLRNLRFEMLDSRNIVYRSGTFDVAMTSFGLPAIGHAQVLREVHRVLKDGATFHVLGWGPRTAESGWDAFEETLREHRTGTPSKALAQLREARDLVARSGDADAIQDAERLTATMTEAGFSDVRVEPHATDVAFATIDDVLRFIGSYGTTERELSEMGEAHRVRFRTALQGRLAGLVQDGAIRLRWRLVYYAATR